MVDITLLTGLHSLDNPNRTDMRIPERFRACSNGLSTPPLRPFPIYKDVAIQEVTEQLLSALISAQSAPLRAKTFFVSKEK